MLGCDPAGLGLPAPQGSGTAAPNPSVVPPPQSGLDAGFDASAVRSDPRTARDGGPELRDAGPPPPPEPFEPNEELAAEHLAGGDQLGVLLWARWDWRNAPAPAGGPDDKDLAGLYQATARAHRIELTAGGRMRFVFESRGLPLPARSTLLARTDRLGSLLFWPEPFRYRVIPPGALRAIFDDRRVDATWLVKARGKDIGTGSRMGLPTRRTQLEGAIGRVDLEVAPVGESGAGASLLCRLLVELAGIHPGTPACRSHGEVVLAATFAWTAGGEIGFEVTQIERRTDLSSSRFAMPPPEARMATGGLPGPMNAQILTVAEMAALPVTQAGPVAAGADTETMTTNHSDRLLWLLLGRVPVGYLAPWHSMRLTGVLAGGHVAQWRSFFGELVSPPINIEVPGPITFGTAEAVTAEAAEGG